VIEPDGERDLRDCIEPDNEPPARPETEAEEWDRNTASNEAYLNRERNRS
jgi:hypothetical protein